MTKNGMVLLLLLMGLGSAMACGDDGTSSGNNEVCGDGETCDNDCSAQQDSCNMECKSGSNCTATCQDGQDCNFNCSAGATCEFDCTKGESCQVQGTGADCQCSGECLGTCGGLNGNNDGNNDVNNTPNNAGNNDVAACIAACGDATDPGFAACVEACQ